MPTIYVVVASRPVVQSSDEKMEHSMMSTECYGGRQLHSNLAGLESDPAAVTASFVIKLLSMSEDGDPFVAESSPGQLDGLFSSREP